MNREKVMEGVRKSTEERGHGELEKVTIEFDDGVVHEIDVPNQDTMGPNGLMLFLEFDGGLGMFGAASERFLMRIRDAIIERVGDGELEEDAFGSFLQELLKQAGQSQGLPFTGSYDEDDEEDNGFH